MHLQLPRSGARPVGPVPPGRGQEGWRKGPLGGFPAGGLVVAATFIGPVHDARALDQTDPDGAAASTPTSAPAVSTEPARHPREKTYIKRQWGVEVMYVRQTAAGYMLEFRYKVLDPDKARPTQGLCVEISEYQLAKWIKTAKH